MSWVIRGLVCLLVLGCCLYDYINRHNELTGLRLKIPTMERDLRLVQERNAQLQYQVESSESPVHLLEMSQEPEFGHLKHPSIGDIIWVPQGEALEGNGL